MPKDPNKLTTAFESSFPGFLSRFQIDPSRIEWQSYDVREDNEKVVILYGNYSVPFIACGVYDKLTGESSTTFGPIVPWENRTEQFYYEVELNYQLMISPEYLALFKPSDFYYHIKEAQIESKGGSVVNGSEIHIVPISFFDQHGKLCEGEFTLSHLNIDILEQAERQGVWTVDTTPDNLYATMNAHGFKQSPDFSKLVEEN